MPIRYITKGKGKNRKTFPIRPKKKGVSVRSVSLQPSAVVKVNKEQIKLLNRGEPATFSKALNQVIIRARREGIPVYDTHVNSNDRRKPYHMWIVKHPEKGDKVKGSDTIVMAEHYGQAIDDMITVWNKENRKKMTIGYPVVQGTAEKSFRYRRDEIRTIRDLDGRDDFDLVQVDTDIEHFLEMFGLPKDEYDGLFIKVKDGDVIEAYGYNGGVPHLDLGVDRIETPAEMLEKKFGKRS